MSYPPSGMMSLFAKKSGDKILYFSSLKEDGMVKFIDNEPLGLMQGSLAESICLQIGDPWTPS